MKWTPVTAPGNVPLREGRSVTISGRAIAIFNLGDRFVAVENRCPHRGGPLADGIVSGKAVVCPLHGWKICLDTGNVKAPNAASCVASYPVKLQDGVVMVRVPAAAEAAA